MILTGALTNAHIARGMACVRKNTCAGPHLSEILPSRPFSAVNETNMRSRSTDPQKQQY
ncbi:hypothetical protein PISMIDRAFT_677000 [Pisolithus microcarpus 441]|uniref:Uncharacterized protein n=1 Tax=Pisolithus microcarpus 441 TaxID=765257 RepID=A0A0C9ZTV4_9AGAM|nr:hypothetical protein PISMIDRAFT_677000 [Pisolithus microcarpus 441]